MKLLHLEHSNVCYSKSPISTCTADHFRRTFGNDSHNIHHIGSHHPNNVCRLRQCIPCPPYRILTTSAIYIKNWFVAQPYHFIGNPCFAQVSMMDLHWSWLVESYGLQVVVAVFAAGFTLATKLNDENPLVIPASTILQTNNNAITKHATGITKFKERIFTKIRTVLVFHKEITSLILWCEIFNVPIISFKSLLIGH